MKPLAVALDLGSTRVKAARLEASGRLSAPVSEPAPPLSGSGPTREGDARAYRAAAERALEAALGGAGAGRAADDVRVGIASQRSTFLLWDRTTGEPRTPMISWQDRRAAEWCRAHRHVEADVTRRTGLVLSPHYLGPKLAMLMEGDAALRRGLAGGDLVAGTLETWLVRCWSEGGVLRTDPTMAARTLLFDLEEETWSEELLRVFAVPRGALARVAPSEGELLPLPGRGILAATISDQAAGVLGCIEGEDGGEGDRADDGRADDRATALVNFGTGTFVLRPTYDRAFRPTGYLLGPVRARAGAATLFALEGSINGGASGVDRFGEGPTDLPVEDPTPGAFCIPDTAGLGAPFWREEISLPFSEGAAGLSDADRRRIVLEGLLFRVRGILADLFPDAPPRRIVLAGGLSAEPFLAQGMAAMHDAQIVVSEEQEGTLLGAAKLAAGTAVGAPSVARAMPRGRRGSYLAAKAERWRAWLNAPLG
ncbi:MAG: FGGY family carbohydrate kinase [Candidatus Eiseniibacteriota bacterium]